MNRQIDIFWFRVLDFMLWNNKKWESKLNFDSHFNIVETVLNFFSDHLHGFTADLFQ